MPAPASARRAGAASLGGSSLSVWFGDGLAFFMTFLFSSGLFLFAVQLPANAIPINHQANARQDVSCGE
jgi:hypothetical protein